MRNRHIVIAGLMIALALAGCEVRKPVTPRTYVQTNTLFTAAQMGNVDLAKALLAAGADPRAVNDERRTPMHEAAEAGFPDFIKWLAESGADLNARDQDGFAPLHSAARGGSLPAVETLIALGADPNTKDVDGYSAAKVAMLARNEPIAEYLYAHGTQHEVPIEFEPPAPEKIAHAPAPQAPSIWLTGETFRAWTTMSGSSMDAEFVQSAMDVVTLRSRNDTLYRIRLNQLTPSDQILVRQLSGLAIPQELRQPAAPKERSIALGDSIAAKIGKGSGWTVLDDCRLLSRSANDGDSFHVSHGGKEYIFRLYYVDCAETSMTFPDRVKEQASYFRLTPAETIKLGEEAKHFTDKILSAAPFTVITKWEDARGNSRLPREYAFVITPQGDLDELLTAAGLVRQYGMHVSDGYGNRKKETLMNLERQAKRNRLGAWGSMKDKNLAASD